MSMIEKENQTGISQLEQDVCYSETQADAKSHLNCVFQHNGFLVEPDDRPSGDWILEAG